MAGGLIDACTQAAAGTLTPAAARAVLDRQLLLVVAVMAVAGVASGVRAYLFNAAAERVMARLRTQLFAKVGGCERPGWWCGVRASWCRALTACLRLVAAVCWQHWWLCSL
jgi:hypothetical protein